MSLAATGGFDIVAEIDQTLITRLSQQSFGRSLTASENFVHSPPSASGPKITVLGGATIELALDRVWFNYDAVPDPDLLRPSLDLMTLVLTMGPASNITVTKLQALGIEVPIPVLNQIPLQGVIAATDQLEVRFLEVLRVVEPSSPPQRVPVYATILDCGPASAPSPGAPGVDVAVDFGDAGRKAILESAPVRAVFLKQEIEAAFSEEKQRELQKDKDGLVTAIADGIRAGITKNLAERVDPAIGIPGVIRLSETPAGGTEPTDTKQQRTRTIANPPSSSLLLLSATAGPFQGVTSISRSQLTPPLRDALALTLSNRLLLRGVIREALIEELGLRPEHFSDTTPCLLTQRVEGLQTASGESFNLTSLLAVIHDGLISIAGGLEQKSIFATATANFQLDIALRVRTVPMRRPDGATVTGLDLQPEIVRRTVSDANLTIEPWVFVVGLAALGLSVATLLGAATLIFAGALDLFAGGEVERRVREALEDIGVGGQDTAPPRELPSGTALVMRSVSLHQPDAEKETFGLPPFVPLLDYRKHDAVITLSSQLNQRLEVGCIISDPADSIRRIQGLGGTLTDGRRWVFGIDDAIAAMEAGQLTLFIVVGGQPVNVRVDRAVLPNGQETKFLTTSQHPSQGNHLLNLPTCPI